jgi:hypothetical protein
MELYLPSSICLKGMVFSYTQDVFMLWYFIKHGDNFTLPWHIGMLGGSVEVKLVAFQSPALYALEKERSVLHVAQQAGFSPESF